MTRQRRFAALAALLAGIGAVSLGVHLVAERPATIPKLRPPRVTPDDEVIVATFPPRWSVGQSWVLEVEQDFVGLDAQWHPGRYFARHQVVAMAGDRAVVQWDVVNEQPPEPRYFVVSLQPLQIRHEKVVQVPDDWAEALLDDRKLSFSAIDEPTTHGCAGAPRPWQLPYSQARDFLGRELVGARLWPWRFEDRTQSAAVVGDAGILFTIEETIPRDPPTALIRWRPGEPWWARLECRPRDAQNGPRSHRAEGSRPFRARLIAVDERPVEVLPWEFPPVDWLAGRPATDADPPPPSGRMPFEEYRASWDSRGRR